MREMFRGYYRATDEEVEKVWREGLIVLDTNALLHMFRYSAPSRDELLALLEKFSDRIWIPHRVGAEFHRIRKSVPVDENKRFDHVERTVEEGLKPILKTLEALHRPVAQARAIEKHAKKRFRQLRADIAAVRHEHHDAVLSPESHGRTFAILTDLYEGKVGRPFDGARMDQIRKDGDARFRTKVPPGYKDSGKSEGLDPDSKYGDLILWFQMLDEAEAKKLPMLFVTSDVKEDWWDHTGELVDSPRPELVEEYYTRSAGERIHFLQPHDFLDQAKNRGASISDATVAEVRSVDKPAPSATIHAEMIRAAMGSGESAINAFARLSRENETALRASQAGLRSFESYLRTSGLADALEKQRREQLSDFAKALSPYSNFAEAERSNSEAERATREALIEYRRGEGLLEGRLDPEAGAETENGDEDHADGEEAE